MKTITLQRPIEHEGKTYASLIVDEPTVGAIEAFEKARMAEGNEVSATMALVAHDSEVPLAALRKMRASDFRAVSTALAPFLTEAEPGASGAGSVPM